LLHGRVRASDEKCVFLSKTEHIVSASQVPTTASAAAELDRRIVDFIAQGSAGDEPFESLALELFAYQFAANPAYRRYCERLGRTPGTVRHWEDVPGIPTSAFAHVRLACFAPERTRLTFLSSGTTHVARSRHELENTALYDASLLAHFRKRVIPDVRSIQMIALSPPFASAPHSSLAYMLSKIGETFGTGGARFFVDDETLDFDGASDALRNASGPVLVVGTAFGFVHFFDRCRETRTRFALPAGSRVIETGGFKGKSREVSGEELYGWFGEVLGVPRALCASEYGMCELGSQWYDTNIADSLAGQPVRISVKAGPHWARSIVVDPVTAKPMSSRQPGLLQIFDLSNRGSVAAVLTGDLVREVQGGFELIGRGPGELPKGCSIAVDAALSHHGD
jgi:hypothetical protein